MQSECVEYQGYINPDGYGRRGNRLAYRVAFEEAHGAIADGKIITHLRDKYDRNESS